MSIALMFNNKDPKEWQLEISRLLPETKVEVYPEIENFKDVDFLISWKPEKNYFTHYPNLNVIQSIGAGIDHLMPNTLPKHIKVARIIDPMLKEDMFEYVLTCLLSSMKNIPSYFENKQQKTWSPLKYSSIYETCVTILGLGEIGSFVAMKLVDLGFNVKGWSNSVKSLKNVESYKGNDELHLAVNDADFVVNILPLTNLTEGILNKKLFENCKKGSVLINVGRGEHLIESDLLEFIENKRFSESYLDVFSQEPLPIDHPFWKCNRIFITPHTASMTNIKSSVQQIVENYERMKQKKDLLNEVSLKRGY